MFKDIFVQGTQAMMSSLSWSGSTIAGYPEPEATVEMYESHMKSWKASESKEENILSEGDVMSGRLSFVHQDLLTLPFRIIDRHWDWVTTLDLSHNLIEEPDFIVYFEKLDTLILDHNILNSKTVFPKMEKLRTLWVNFNEIDRLFPWIDNLNQSFGNLQYLSMMGNPAAPSFVNGGNFHDYLIYRLYVISRMGKLKYLDDREIETDEREEAMKIYSSSTKLERAIKNKVDYQGSPKRIGFSHLEVGQPVYALGTGSDLILAAKKKFLDKLKKRPSFRRHFEPNQMR